MLSRPAKVRQVYNELKRVFGEEFSAVELLRQASKFVEYIDKSNEVDAEFLRSTDPRSSTPRLDVAFADGGWRLLFREGDWIAQCFDDDDFVPKSYLRKKYPEMERSLFADGKGNLAREWMITEKWLGKNEK